MAYTDSLSVSLSLSLSPPPPAQHTTNFQFVSPTSLYFLLLYLFFPLLLSYTGNFLCTEAIGFSRVQCNIMQNWLQKTVALEKVHSTYENSKHSMRYFHIKKILICWIFELLFCKQISIYPYLYFDSLLLNSGFSLIFGPCFFHNRY